MTTRLERISRNTVSTLWAATVFSDPLARIFLDENHSSGELREIIIGHSSRKRLLLVCFTEPKNEQVTYQREERHEERAARL